MSNETRHEIISYPVRVQSACTHLEPSVFRPQLCERFSGATLLAERRCTTGPYRRPEGVLPDSTLRVFCSSSSAPTYSDSACLDVLLYQRSSSSGFASADDVLRHQVDNLGEFTFVQARKVFLAELGCM